MADRLAELTIEEISGVDHPANLVEGWLVMKAKKADMIECPTCKGTGKIKGGLPCPTCKGTGTVPADYKPAASGNPFGKADDDDVIAELERIMADATSFAKGHGELMAAMEAAKPYLESAPDEVKAAANTLYAFLQSMGTDPAAAPGAPATPAPAPAPAGYAAAQKNFVMRALEKLFGNVVAKTETETTEDDMTPEEQAEFAKTVAAAIVEAQAAAEVAKAEAAAEAEAAAATADADASTASTDDAAATTDEEAATAAADAEAAAAADADVAKAKADADAEASHAATRDALEKALDRIERLEGRFGKSKQVAGQETNEPAEPTTPVVKSDADIFKGIRDNAARAGADPNTPMDLS